MRAIAQGRLSRSVRSRHIVDVALADREWAANTDLSRAPDQVKARAAAQAAGGEQRRAANGNQQIVDEPADPAGLATASAREKHFRAKLAELKYLERAGELVEAAAVLAAWIDQITIARTKLLGIPSKFKQRRSHQTLEDLADLEALLREALEALALIRTAAA